MMNYFKYRCQRFLHVLQKWLFRHFTPTGLGILAGLFLSAIAALGSTQSLIYLLIFLGLALLASAKLSSRFIQYRFKITRTLPQFGTVGEPLTYQVTIQNLTPQAQPGLKFSEIFPDRFPSFSEFLRIKAHDPIGSQWVAAWRGHVARQQKAIAPAQELPVLAAETATKVKGEVLPLQRGRLELAAIALDCPDPLGLIYKRQTYLLPQSVCILPQRYPIPPLQFPSTRRHPLGETAMAAAIGESLEFRALRDYRPGDPTHKIHWKSWAKVGRPIVKEHQDDCTAHHALVLDTFQTAFESEILEAAITVALSVLTQDHPAETRLDVIFASREARCVTVGKGLRQRTQILETLATLGPQQNQDLDLLIPMLETRLSRLSGCLCIFISDNETRYDLLNLLVQHGIPTKAIFLCAHNRAGAGDASYYLSPQCRTHFVSIDNLQQDLLLI